MTYVPVRFMIAAALLLSACRGTESPGDKREWSILQTLEFQSRGTRVSAIEFRMVDTYEVMGVPREGDAQVLWVLLKPQYGPLYKQMPHGNFWIDPELHRQLWREHRLSETVAEALASHFRTDTRIAVPTGAAQQ